MIRAKFQVAADVFDGWRDDLLTGRAPVLYPIGTGELARIEVGPGLVTLVGGPPGSGKTSLTMQAVIDALRSTPDLRALVCNVEMSAATLLDRQLARLSGVNLTAIRHRRLEAEHADRIDQGLDTLAAVADRLCFTRPPFDLGNIAATADDFGATLLLLDYIQRIDPPRASDEARQRVNATMDFLRQFANAGVAVIVVSAVGRTRDRRGRSSYSGEGLNLASFRESSELEFGADDAFILHPVDDKSDAELVSLKHLKSRHGECRSLTLRFDRARQSFTSPTPKQSAPGDEGKLTASLRLLWSQTPSAVDEDDDDHEVDG